MADRAIAGWDLGGAHLKAALVAANGEVRDVVQLPCPLWQGLEHLSAAMRTVVDRFGPVGQHAVTMTGELVDLFEDRAEGVARIVAAVHRILDRSDLQIYAGTAGFLAPGEAAGRPRLVASANWLASAAFAARLLPSGLFLDLGSTTTDIVGFAGGAMLARGLTDAERLREGELVYTGLTRTPLMAVAGSAPFAGGRYPLMAENFATMADVHRLADGLPEAADQEPTSDGRGKSDEDSARRLARMIGHDLDDATLDAWRGLARFFVDRQRRRLCEACQRILARDALGGEAPVVGAGVGRHVIRELADSLGRPYRDFASLVRGGESACDRAADCAPAVAVAMLLMSPAPSMDRTADSRSGSSRPARSPRHSAPRKPR